MSAWALPRSAWPISIALHVLVLVALSKVSLPGSDLERRFEREILRFELRPQSAGELPPATDDLPPATLDEIAIPDRIVQRSIEPVPARDEVTDAEMAPDAPDDQLVETRNDESAFAPDIVAPAPGPATTVDFEAIRKEAVAGVIEQAERDAAYRQFSLEDLVEDSPPDDSQNVPSVFEVESSGRSRAGPLSPGRQRTALGRAMAEICRDLGGIGFSVFGLGGALCGEPGSRADAFGHLRPQYMDSLPVCTEVEPADIGDADPEGALDEVLLASTDADDIEPVIKCRLVPREERVDGTRPERAR